MGFIPRITDPPTQGQKIGPVPSSPDPHQQMAQLAQSNPHDYATVQQLDDYYQKLMQMIAGLQPVLNPGGGVGGQSKPAPSPQTALNNFAIGPFMGNQQAAGGYGQLYRI